MATVRISGNWRNPSKMEWGGALPLDEDGHIERSLALPEGVYEAIEDGIAQGNVEGSIYLPAGTRVQWSLDA
jgi:hypothetical protein